MSAQRPLPPGADWYYTGARESVFPDLETQLERQLREQGEDTIGIIGDWDRFRHDFEA